MMILEGLRNPVYLLALLTALVVGLTVHEYAHAWSAFKLGDLTAYLAGRMSLDPRKHIDPLGALVFLLAGFGWARPVPINPYRLGRYGTVAVSVAGPVSNLLLATLAALASRILAGPALIVAFLQFFTVLNLALAVFNMLPVAPLDGWRVLVGVVPPATAARLQEWERYSALALLFLVAFGRFGDVSILGALIGTPVSFLADLLLGG